MLYRGSAYPRRRRYISDRFDPVKNTTGLLEGGERVETTRVMEPGDTPISVAEVKEYLRITSTKEDGLLERLIRLSIDLVEKSYLLAIQYQTVTAILGGPANYLSMPRSPIVGIDQIKLLDPSGNATEEDKDQYYWEGSPRANLHKVGYNVILRQGYRLEVAYKAGYDDIAHVEPVLIEALFKTIGTYYEQRSEVAVGRTISSLPNTVKEFMKEAGY